MAKLTILLRNDGRCGRRRRPAVQSNLIENIYWQLATRPVGVQHRAPSDRSTSICGRQLIGSCERRRRHRTMASRIPTTSAPAMACVLPGDDGLYNTHACTTTRVILMPRNTRALRIAWRYGKCRYSFQTVGSGPERCLPKSSSPRSSTRGRYYSAGAGGSGNRRWVAFAPLSKRRRTGWSPHRTLMDAGDGSPRHSRLPRRRRITRDAGSAWCALLPSIPNTNISKPRIAMSLGPFGTARPNGWLPGNCLTDNADDSALTHTIAYSIRGILEVGLALDKPQYLSHALRMARGRRSCQNPDGSLPAYSIRTGSPRLAGPA